jgi:hypothetical protein
MKRATPIRLSEDERTHVEVFVRRGKANARTLTRAHILLKCDEDWSNGDITEAFDVSDQCIGYIGHLFEKKPPGLSIASSFSLSGGSSAFDRGGEWFSYTRENTGVWAANHQERHAKAP